ncbi:MAG: NADH-quinone oxidoreductase subunit NuoE [Deltaproteobacteria bacterium]|nr:NADH-quinone oxidoreductase subunit NuoE [Deltaproteobacteria bacterium]
MEQAIYQELSVESMPEVEGLFNEIRKEFKGRADELIPMLQRVQRTLGFLPEQALLEIARLTGLSAARVFGTATFYAQFRFQPVGKYIIRVCRGTACHVKGSNRILETIEEHLQVTPGQITPDGLFTIETVACFGSCALAPIMVVNDSVYGSVNRSRALKLLDEIRVREEASTEKTFRSLDYIDSKI